jgi:hypothetical protein
MKTALQTLVANAGSGDLYRAFRRLGQLERRRVALRILRDEEVLKDLYDHFLIQDSLRAPGRSISWDRYRSRKNTTER